MSNDLFHDIDRYIDGLFVPADADLAAAMQSSVEAGMPQIHVSPSQGKALYLLAKACGARRILELGALAGYSGIWLARALPAGGQLVSLEMSPDYAALARKNLQRAGLGERVEYLVGPALETLPKLVERAEPSFDLIFIDADKINYPSYLEWAIRLSRSGTLILADNVIREGKVMNPEAADANAQGAAAFNKALAADARVEATAIQWVGAKGHDGMAIAVVK